MLPNYVLLDILKCMNRNGLAKIQKTAQVIKNIIQRDFASKPFHIFDETICLRIRRNEKNEILIGVFRRNTDNNGKCFLPSIRGLRNCNAEEECWHCYSFDEMRPFLANYIRYTDVRIEIDNVDNGLPPYVREQITFLESISHIWTRQMLRIEDYLENSIDYNLKGILGSPEILKCNFLNHWKSSEKDEIMSSIIMDLQQCPYLYTLPAFYFSCPILKNDILHLTHYKAAYPQRDTTLVLYYGYIDGPYNRWLYSMLDALDAIKEEFLTSSVPCRLRVISENFLLKSTSLVEYDFLASSQPERFQYRLKNNRTKEVLQLNQITKQEAKEKFDVALYANAKGFQNYFQNYSFTEGTDGKALILERFAV